jgi:hypothetical protein
LLPKTDVTEVIKGEKVRGVKTTKGPLHASVVVDAAGAWTRQVAEASDIRVPLVPTRQQLIVTEALEGARADLPMVRIMDAAVYIRPCQGGFLWGVYEEDPRFFDMKVLGPAFDVKDMPLDVEVLRRAAVEVKAQLPFLQTARTREFRGGIPTMTADGHHVLGPAPAVKGFFFASGCNVAGLSISPTVGEALAAWIVDGQPPIDLSPMSPARFSNKYWSEEQLRRDCMAVSPFLRCGMTFGWRTSDIKFPVRIANASPAEVLDVRSGPFSAVDEPRRDVRFSNRPSGVKRFQTIRHHSDDVARGLVLLFGIGTRALPSLVGCARRRALPI